MGNLTIKLVDDTSSKKGLRFRETSFRLGTGQTYTMKPALVPRYLRKPTKERIKKEDLLENVVMLKLDDLRNIIDNDPVQQRKFIHDEMKVDKFENLSLNIIILLVKENQKVSIEDIRHLTNIFTLYSYRTLSFVPLIYHYEEKRIKSKLKGIPIEKQTTVRTTPLDITTYLSFTKEFLKQTNEFGYVNEIGFSLPTNLPLERGKDLLELYKDFSTPIIISDAHGQEQLGFLPQIREIENSPGGYSLKEKLGENYAFYGFDSLKSKITRNSGEIIGAKNVGGLLYRFSSFGHTYTTPKIYIKRQVNELPIRPEPRIYLSEELGYAKKGYKMAHFEIEDWISNNFKDYKEGKPYSYYVKDYENIGLIRSFNNLKTENKEGNLDKYIESSAFKKDIGIMLSRINFIQKTF